MENLAHISVTDFNSIFFCDVVVVEPLQVLRVRKMKQPCEFLLEACRRRWLSNSVFRRAAFFKQLKVPQQIALCIVFLGTDFGDFPYSRIFRFLRFKLDYFRVIKETVLEGLTALVVQLERRSVEENSAKTRKTVVN